MKIGGMGEQALRIHVYELRRLHEIPEDVEILAVLPELPTRPATVHVDRAGQPGYGASVYEYRGYEGLPEGWVPHPKPVRTVRCLYVHIQHRYCFRGTENGAVLTIEELGTFLQKYRDLHRQEELWKNEKVADHFPEECSTAWVDN